MALHYTLFLEIFDFHIAKFYFTRTDSFGQDTIVLIRTPLTYPLSIQIGDATCRAHSTQCDDNTKNPRIRSMHEFVVRNLSTASAFLTKLKRGYNELFCVFEAHSAYRHLLPQREPVTFRTSLSILLQPPELCHMPAKRRVLHLVTWLNQGGIETWLIRYLEIANKSGQWQADVLCRGRNTGQLADHAKSLGAGVFHLPLASPTRRNAHRLAEFLTNQRYDVLHCHLNSLNALAIEAAKLANVPVVAMYHNERLYPQRSGIVANITRPLLRWYTNRWSDMPSKTQAFLLRFTSCYG